MDRLIVQGIPGLAGEYPCDIVAMLQLNNPATLTSREANRIKEMSKVRAGELQEALAAGDNDVLVALAAIVLTRAGKTVNADALWDAPMGAVTFEIATREEPEDAGDPKDETPTGEPSTTGGTSSPSTSARLESVPSRTGHLDSETSAISAPSTSAISR